MSGKEIREEKDQGNNKTWDINLEKKTLRILRGKTREQTTVHSAREQEILRACCP